jgi:hypothetical protein
MHINTFLAAPLLVATLVSAEVTFASVRMRDRPSPDQHISREVMLILRGIASSDNPRGQLDEPSALEYARRLGFWGEVLDVPGSTDARRPQVGMALERIRRDESVTAIYGFSGGGYNARLIWKELNAAERGRIRKLIVVGSPEVSKADFAGHPDVLIKLDPPAGHMAGPKALLESLDRDQDRGSRSAKL